jgi:hypothetical protein
LFQFLYQLILAFDNVMSFSSVRRIQCQCAFDVLKDTDVIDDKSMSLPFVDNTIRTSDRLHKGMVFERFIQIESRQVGNIEAGKPHSADKDNAKLTIRVFEFVFQRDHLSIS